MNAAHMVRHVVIRGRVQRVGYRAWTEHMALQRGLEGWVRNRPDGTVEAVFAGPASVVEAMIEACRRGPPGAQVDAHRCARRRSRRYRVAPPRRVVLGAADRLSAAAGGSHALGPNSGSNSRRSTMSTSARLAGWPRSSRLVTP